MTLSEHPQSLGHAGGRIQDGLDGITPRRCSEAPASPRAGAQGFGQVPLAGVGVDGLRTESTVEKVFRAE